MSLEIYFDETLIDEKYYVELNNNCEMFNDSFKLGTTPCSQYILKVVKEGVSEQPNIVLIKDSGILISELIIDSIQEEDYLYVYNLSDKMVNLNFYYDASEIFVNGSTTLYNIAMDICSKAGLILGTTNFRGYNKIINWYDNTRTARDYIGCIAELNGGFARIEGNILYFKKQNRPNETVITFTPENCESYKLGERHKITRVVYQLGNIKYEFGNETGDTLYLNSNNVYITEESEVQAIYNNIKNFEFINYEFNSLTINRHSSLFGNMFLIGDIIDIEDENNNHYQGIVQYNLDYFGGWNGTFSLDVNTQKEEETKIVGYKDSIRNIKITVDRQNNEISQVIEDVGEQNQKISQINQTVGELNSKIQDIADITTFGETTYAYLELDDINQSQPIEVKIYPTTTSITYDYPIDTLYPSDTFYMKNRILRFTNTDTDEVFDYELPDDLLITGNGVYDEFYLEYDNQVCQVTKRCQYNADGTVSALANEVINTYTYPTINLTDGDYTVELLGYNNGYLGVRLMAQNIYTTQFATIARLESEISQTATEITSTVSATYETKQNANINYSQLRQTSNSISATVANNNTKANIIAKINDNTSQVQIDADNIDLNANDVLNILAGNTIGLTSKNISINSNNFSVDTNGNMSCYNANVRGNVYLYGNNSLTSYNSSGYVANKIDRYGLALYGDTGDFTGRVSTGYNSFGGTSYKTIALVNNTGGALYVYPLGIFVDGTVHTTSEESKKKNIELYKESALQEILNSDIYKYNLKTEKDDDKKHIGLVIGDKYNASKEVIDNNSVDLYSMIAVAWKAIQEQQEQIKELKKEIKELKGEK